MSVSAGTTSTCNKVYNCTVNDGNAEGQQLTYEEGIYSGCAKSQMYGEVCLNVKQQQSQGAERVIVMIQDYVMMNALLHWNQNGSEYCLDDASLLEVLLKIPALQPYYQVIYDIYEASECIPAGIFSVCLIREPGTFCYQLVSQLFYFENFCYKKSVVNIGCI